MGLSLLSRNRRQAHPPAVEQSLQERFSAYFAPLFAYARSFVDDDTAASEIVVEAFSRALARSPQLSDGEFRLVLFGMARDLCDSAASGKAREDDPLSPRQREVLSLLFDAQLSRSEIGRLLKVKEETITSAIAQGLLKLRASTTPATIAAYLKLS